MKKIIFLVTVAIFIVLYKSYLDTNYEKNILGKWSKVEKHSSDESTLMYDTITEYFENGTEESSGKITFKSELKNIQASANFYSSSTWSIDKNQLLEISQEVKLSRYRGNSILFGFFDNMEKELKANQGERKFTIIKINKTSFEVEHESGAIDKYSKVTP